MSDDDETFLESIIDDLRTNEGEMYRRLLRRLRHETNPEAKALVETLLTHPRLRDLSLH